MVGQLAEQGQELTFAGVTVLGFDNQGKAVDHTDYDNNIERQEQRTRTGEAPSRGRPSPAVPNPCQNVRAQRVMDGQLRGRAQAQRPGFKPVPAPPEQS